MKINIKGINIVRKRLSTGDETVYIYAWKGGPRIYAALGSQEFLGEYNKAIERKVEKPKNLSNILDEYTRSKKFNKNKKTTIRRTLVSIKQVKATLGEMPARAFDDPDVIDVLESWRDSLVIEKSPASAEHQWNSLSGALTWAAERTYIKRNPCKGHYVSLIGSRVDKIWSDEQIEQYIKLAPSNMVIALMLGLWTGQREGSLVNLHWSDYDGNILTVVQEKNRNGTPPKIVKIPVRGEFKIFMNDLERKAGVVGLSEEERSQRAILLNTLGREWKVASFCTIFGKTTRNVVGIKDRIFHDLRGTAVTKLFIAGCTDAEIATITGHSLKNVRAILDRHYFHRDIMLAEQAMEKRLAREGDLLTAQMALAAEGPRAKVKVGA